MGGLCGVTVLVGVSLSQEEGPEPAEEVGASPADVGGSARDGGAREPDDPLLCTRDDELTGVGAEELAKAERAPIPGVWRRHLVEEP